MSIDDLLGPILQAHRPLRLDDSVDNLPSWDSTRHVDVILAVEEMLDSSLSATEISRLKSIRDIVELFRTRGVNVSISNAQAS